MRDKSRSPDEPWMKAEVNRLLRQLGPSAAPASPASAPPGPGTRPLGRAGPGFRPGQGVRPRSGPLTHPPAVTLPSSRGVWGRVALGVALTGAMTQWPYRYCGLSLLGYLAAVTVVVVAGVWAGHAAWRRRMGRAHVIAIGVIFAGAALAALQILPRFGYAAMETTWRCAP